MKILKMLSQHRRDFTAILSCEHCKHEEKLMTGYDDSYYHNSVIPFMKCNKCGLTGNTPPQQPKYPDGYQI